MIERKFVSQNFKEFQIKEFIKKSLNRVGLSDVKLKRTSLGERIIISASRPGLVVGRGGSNIQSLTRDLKSRFNLENPQIEIEEIKSFSTDAAVVAEMIVNQLERFGTRRFKGIGHKTVESVMRAGALGVEILISGRVPSSRGKTWRFAEGYMKKCGDLAITGVDTAIEEAHLKIGSVGVQVRILPGDVVLPDSVTFDRETIKKAEEEQKSKSVDDKKEADSDSSDSDNESKESSAKKSTKKSSKKKSSAKKSTKKAASKKSSKKTASKKEESDDKKEDADDTSKDDAQN